MMLIQLPQNWKESWKYSPDLFQAVFSLKGEIFREQPGRKTLKFNKFDQNYFLKIHYGVGWREIFKNLLQLKHPVLGAQNEVKAIQKLAPFHFTPILIGYGWRGENPAAQQSFVITEALENTVSLEDYCREWKTHPPELNHKRLLIKKIAHITKTMHENGVNHRDFYICHFLLNTQNNHLFVIDWHRAQTRKKVPVRWRIKDLAGLYFSAMDAGLTKTDLWRFIKSYTTEPYHPIFWRLVTKRAKKLYRKTFKRDPNYVS